MPLSMTKIPANELHPKIEVGQVYVCTQKHHKGWKVEVVKVGELHIEARGIKGNQASRSKAHSTNGNYNYLRTQFERDYMLITDTPDKDEVLGLPGTPDAIIDGVPVRSLDEPMLAFNPELPMICKRCNEMKAAEHFRRTYGKRMAVCNACMVKAQMEGKARRIKVVKPTSKPTSEPTPVIVPTPANHAALIANQLVELASQVEQLSYPTGLLHAVRDLLLDLEVAHGVCIVPSSYIDRLQAEFNLIKNNVSWSDPMYEADR